MNHSLINPNHFMAFNILVHDNHFYAKVFVIGVDKAFIPFNSKETVISFEF